MAKKHRKSVGFFANQPPRCAPVFWSDSCLSSVVDGKRPRGATCSCRRPTTNDNRKNTHRWVAKICNRKRCHVFFLKVRCGRELGKEVVVYPLSFFRNAWFFLFLERGMKLGGCVTKTFKGWQLFCVQDFASIPWDTTLPQMYNGTVTTCPNGGDFRWWNVKYIM